jgi:signal peptidase II
MKSKYLVFAWVILFLLVIDQAVKIYVHTQFQLGESIPVIRDFFHITYVRNSGAAFGLLSDSPETFRHLFFLSIPVIAVVMIFFMLRSTPDWDHVQIYALSSIAGGALGNYVDRLRYGYVVDYLDFHYKNVYSYPAFNIADSAIVVGVFCLSLLIIRDMKSEKLAKQKSAENAKA